MESGSELLHPVSSVPAATCEGLSEGTLASFPGDFGKAQNTAKVAAEDTERRWFPGTGCRHAMRGRGGSKVREECPILGRADDSIGRFLGRLV